MKTARFVTLGLLLLLLAGAAQAQQGAIKIGVFDPLRVSQETAVGQKIAAQLKAKLDEKQAEVSRLQQEVTDLQQQAQTQALSLSEAKRNELGMQIQRKSLDLNAARETATRQLQLEQAEAQARFEESLLAVVEQFGKNEGFTLILDRGSVVWAAQATDVTTGVVDLFNQMFPATDDASGGTQGP
jgi:outer membrane protein